MIKKFSQSGNFFHARKLSTKTPISNITSLVNPFELSDIQNPKKDDLKDTIKGIEGKGLLSNNSTNLNTYYQNSSKLKKMFKKKSLDRASRTSYGHFKLYK